VSSGTPTLSTTLGTSSPLSSGSTETDTATFGGLISGINPTGTVSYYLLVGEQLSTCPTIPTGGTPEGSFTLTSASVGIIPGSDTTSPLAAGYYAFYANYSGDSNYSKVTSACEPFQVGAITPTLSTTLGTPTPPALSLGSTETDTATFGGLVSGINPTGTVSYYLITGVCSSDTLGSGGNLVNTVTVGSGGTIPGSAATVPLAGGNYAFYANYSGDSNYNKVTSDCEPFTVNPATPTLLTEIEVTSPTVSFYDSATLGDLVAGFYPTGTVSYYLISGSCNSSTPGSEGKLVNTVTIGSEGAIPDSTSVSLETGNYAFYAVYSGDNSYVGVWGLCEPFSVSPSVSGVGSVTMSAGTVVAVNQSLGESEAQ